MAESLTVEEVGLVDSLIKLFKKDENQNGLKQHMEILIAAIANSNEILKYIHSIKARIKDSDHLRGKLERKVLEARAKGLVFDINEDNLFLRINDLIGIRVLHLYTRQFEDIDRALRVVFSDLNYPILEGPFARTWDDETRAYFQGLDDVGVKDGDPGEDGPTMYTSVHYVLETASRRNFTCEIQVRTLSEEVWGEVDHTVNYPVKAKSIACREQIKVLARVTSSATRLVDSIFVTVDEYERQWRNADLETGRDDTGGMES